MPLSAHQPLALVARGFAVMPTVLVLNLGQEAMLTLDST
jgi:hypothetical protein